MKYLNNRMKSYTAPDGFVYDYAIDREDHLYVKYLYLT